MRALALLIFFPFLAAAVAASDRAKPINTDAPVINDNAHIWLQICDPIHPFSPPTPFMRPKKAYQV